MGTPDEIRNVAIAADGLSKSFGSRTALDGVTFSLKKGEVLGYVGPNGAGKTTTLRIVTGTEAKFGGRLAVQGFKMPADREKVYRHLGYMPQSVAFGGWRTARETLFLLGQLSGMEESHLNSRVPVVMEMVGLATEMETKLQGFSGGMRQRLGLAQAILHEPSILVLDEPFNHLDPTGRVQLKRILAELNGQGVSILFSSHILSDVEEIVHRLVVLQAGKLRFLGTPSELRACHAGAREVEVAFSAGGRTMEIVSGISGVASIRSAGDCILRFTPGPESKQDTVTTKVLEALIGSGHTIRHVTPITPGLEEIISRLGEEDPS